jgi:hypothetical protein
MNRLALTPLRRIYSTEGVRMIEREIRSISDFIGARTEDTAQQRRVTWYRGHSDASWSLTPGYLRAGAVISESTLMTRFKQSAAMLTQIAPQSDFDWLFVMQHYGVPTRLLDWSESPLVALYFAVEGATHETATDAALWCLKPSLLNRNANIVGGEEEDYIPSFDDEVLQGYSPASVRTSTRAFSDRSESGGIPNRLKI